jgi:hypothetical protein
MDGMLQELRAVAANTMHIGHWREIQKEGDHWEDQDVGGWTILKIGWDAMD